MTQANPAHASRVVRICSAQLAVHRTGSWDTALASVRFFASVADAYRCHFLVLPELWGVQHLSGAPDTPPAEAAAELADKRDAYVQACRDLATRYRLHIIGGSHPIRRGARICNVAHLFTPTGGVYSQDKLHITPSEVEDFGISAGDGLRVFHTERATVALQVCYDVEFPELSRQLALAGAEVLFVPYWTDDAAAYQRVRACAQARAIENSVCVALAGLSGTIDHPSAQLSYGQAAVLVPSDIGFPPGGIAAVGPHNLEGVAIAEVDLAQLARVRDQGSVRPLRDRRPELCVLDGSGVEHVDTRDDARAS